MPERKYRAHYKQKATKSKVHTYRTYTPYMQNAHYIPFFKKNSNSTFTNSLCFLASKIFLESFLPFYIFFSFSILLNFICFQIMGKENTEYCLIDKNFTTGNCKRVFCLRRDLSYPMPWRFNSIFSSGIFYIHILLSATYDKTLEKQPCP